MSSAYSGQTATLVPATLRGFRNWTVNQSSEGYNVVGQYGGTWRSKELIAECKLKRHANLNGPNSSQPWAHEPFVDNVPLENCTCGIYARYSPDKFHPRTGRYGNIGSVYGIIEASGTIIMGTEGFRAQRAKIVALYGAHGSIDIAKLGKQFQVNVYRSLAEALIDYPIEDLSALGIQVERELTPDTWITSSPRFDSYLSYKNWQTANETFTTNISSCTCSSCELAKRLAPKSMTPEEHLRLKFLRSAISNPEKRYNRVNYKTIVYWDSGTETETGTVIETVSGNQIIEEERSKLGRSPSSMFEAYVKQALYSYDYQTTLKAIMKIELIHKPLSNYFSDLGGA